MQRWVRVGVALALLVLVTVVRAGRGLQNTVLLMDKALPSSVTTFSKAVSKRCECRMFCFVSKECHFATVQQEASGMVCRGTDQEDVYASLVRTEGVHSFYWSIYRLIGVRYYRLYTTGADWFTASERCKDEGGQLVVADALDKRGELNSFLQQNGNVKVWIGLLGTPEEMTQNINPAWQSINGGIVREEPDYQNNSNQCFYYVFDQKTFHTSNLNHVCNEILSYVCQRDW